MATNRARLSLYLQDSSGFTSTTGLYLTVDTAQTVAQVLAEAQAVRALLDPLSDAKIISAQMVLYAAATGGEKGAAGSTVDCIKQAGIAFTNDTTAYPWDVSVPAILPAKLSGRHLNTGDSDVAAFINHLDANSGAYRYGTDGGANLTGLSYTFLRVRKPTPAEAGQSYAVAG